MRRFKADLHIHTCLSPCADLDMTPRAVVEMSARRGLDLIAICDHNSAENVAASMRAGLKRGIVVLPGMEITSREEAHVLAIFDRDRAAIRMQETVYRHLDGANRPEIFGDQVVVNEFDEVEGFNDHLLIGATRLGLREIVKEIHRLEGMAIASHVERPSFSVLGQLGFIPPDVSLDALEVADPERIAAVIRDFPDTGRFSFVTSSDAHFPADIGKRHTTFLLEAAELKEIRMALRRESGRKAAF